MRRVTIACYPADDSVAIYEQAVSGTAAPAVTTLIDMNGVAQPIRTLLRRCRLQVKGAGYPPGTLLRRQRYRKPDATSGAGSRGAFWTAADFVPGAVVDVFAFKLRVLGVDPAPVDGVAAAAASVAKA